MKNVHGLSGHFVHLKKFTQTSLKTPFNFQTSNHQQQQQHMQQYLNITCFSKFSFHCVGHVLLLKKLAYHIRDDYFQQYYTFLTYSSMGICCENLFAVMIQSNFSKIFLLVQLHIIPLNHAEVNIYEEEILQKLTNQTMTVAIDMAAAFKRAKQLRRVKLSAHSVNNAALERVDQQSLWKRATFGALLWLTATLTR
ncbi:hypothetical protein T4C_2602 [Trichinella pseudospiralis]|uniref:Uncharacterized protein n=1 Tax=Trichinella pseudospiralis TaxID=6337 RepID=A0A0V1KFK6_TRIPS|nr:hypothetical protein T4C_2602 [Trichinella pseudospiralis]